MTITNKHKQSEVVGVRFTLTELSQLSQLASKDGRTKSGYIRKIVSDHIKEELKI